MIDVGKYAMCAVGRGGFAIMPGYPAHTLQVMEISKVGDSDFFTKPYAQSGGRTVQEAKAQLTSLLRTAGWTSRMSSISFRATEA